MANELKDEDIEAITTKYPKYNTTEGLVDWLQHLANNKYGSEWEAMHDKGFRGLLKKLMTQATPEEIEKLGDQNDYNTKGYTFNKLKGMYDEGEKGLNRRDYLTRFMNNDIDELDMYEKGNWKKRKVYPEDLGITDVSKYEDLIKNGGDIFEVANKIGLDVAPNAGSKQFDELKEDLSDWILDQRKIDTNKNGKIEKDEMADFQKSLDDYACKNKKGREDIPATYKR